MINLKIPVGISDFEKIRKKSAETVHFFKNRRKVSRCPCFGADCTV